MSWKKIARELQQEIMKTDIYIEIQFRAGQEDAAAAALEESFAMFRDFESRYSRFQKENELWRFNESESCVVSDELFSLLKQSKDFSQQTRGLFNPALLPALEKEGYLGAYAEERQGEWRPEQLDALALNQSDNTITKPKTMKIDLGGIGKGFVVDKVARFLATRFENFLVDAGGDIFAAGRNMLDDQNWGIDVEDPHDSRHTLAMLLLSGKGVATSGSNRRRWEKEGEPKHHLIHPESGKSFPSDLATATVIAEDATSADVFAKTLFLLGKNEALAFAEEKSLSAILAMQDGKILFTPEAIPYVWNTL
ncbi:MAG: hypothetical protein A2808_03920 [Candidatus Moranbacteria bacterium RIFCSPHIGHO2_01_FULL_55_24]|nr:MAG: hypothetical protein A2808_03920 [Candidatus Moranbacteria bacterium RIFCSPHIGHO2_01_FULL_55_24]